MINAPCRCEQPGVILRSKCERSAWVRDFPDVSRSWFDASGITDCWEADNSCSAVQLLQDRGIAVLRGKRSDIDSWDLIQSVPEPRSLGVCVGIGLLLGRPRPARVVRRAPGLFPHWRLLYAKRSGAGSRISREAHVRFYERAVVKFRRATRLVIFGEAHLRRILSAYAVYYNHTRTHLALNKDCPLERPIQRFGSVAAIPVLAGLHHQYARI